MALVQATLPVGTPIEIWWQDEARVGQKTKITPRWPKPSAMHSHASNACGPISFTLNNG